MLEIKYFEPKNINEVISLLSTHKDGAKILAGGTALLVLLKQKIFIPQCLINIKKIENLRYITLDDEKGIKVGALNLLTDMEFNPVIGKKVPLLVEGIKSMASPLIRNLATIGGNICHGDPASSVISPLIALDCRLRLVGSVGERWVSMDEFYIDMFEAKIRPDEILAELYIPFPPSNSGGTYLWYGARKAMERPIVSVATIITLNSKDLSCEKVRVVIGGIAKTPIRAKGIEEMLLGRKIDLGVIEEAGNTAYQEVSPTGDIYNSAAYKREMVRVFVKRAIALAFKRVETIN